MTMGDTYPVQMKGLLQAKDFLAKLSYITGFSCMERDWKFNIRCVFTITLSIVFWICFVNTVIISTSDIFQMLETLCCMGISAPASLKLIAIIKMPRTLRALWEFPVEVNQKNVSGRRSDVLRTSSDNSLHLIKVLTCMFGSSSLIFVGYPLYIICVDHKRTLFISVHIPFIDMDTLTGYLINFVHQVILSAYAIPGNMAYDMFMAMTISTIEGQISIFECQLQQLNELYEREESPKNVAYRRAFAKNMFLQLLDLYAYVNNLNDSFGHTTLTLQVIFSSLAIVLALFSIVANNWMSGYGFAFFAFTQIFMLCYMGTIVSTQNARLYVIVYNSKWYMYDAHDKMVIHAMLFMSQNSREMWIGPFAPLNVETAMNIVKNIYSYYTMMIQFLEE